MSYKKPNTGNSMNDYFTRLGDFTRLAPNLLDAKTEQSFHNWLEKLAVIDRRSLILYLRKYKDQIPDGYMDYARLRLGSRLGV